MTGSGGERAGEENSFTVGWRLNSSVKSQYMVAEWHIIGRPDHGKAFVKFPTI